MFRIKSKSTKGHVDQLIEKHKDFLKSGYSKGWILCSGTLVDKNQGGIFVTRTPAEKQIKIILKNNEFLESKIVDYKIYKFKPSECNPMVKDWFELTENVSSQFYI